MRRMPIQIDKAVAFLSDDRPVVQIPGAPLRDFARSPAACRIGELAAENGLFLFNFEHRVELELPDAWIEPGRQEEAQTPQWVDGMLPERKYQSFRHDLQIGSFHPGHRAKWTTHELCHGLVGFAWSPDGTPFFHAMAGRLAELLPVALWYFFDEFRLGRCRDHKGSGALFQTFCPRCEEVAAEGPREWDSDRWIRGGIGYFEKELEKLDASLREGRPIANRWFQIDLTGDGVAYARGHHRRLSSASFGRFAEQFLVPGGGYHRDIASLRERVVAVAKALLLGEALTPFAAPEEARNRWIVQDMAWRLLQIRAETDGEAAVSLDRLIDLLASDRSPEVAVEAYIALHEEVFVPAPSEIFAVGYAIGDVYGHGCAQLRAGLASICPLTLEIFDDAGVDPVAAFSRLDPARRVSLGLRWADWLTSRHPQLADLARYELALRTAKSDPVGIALGTTGADARVRLSHGAMVLVVDTDVVRLAEQVDSGEVQGVVVDGTVELHDGAGATPVIDRHALIVARDGAGELLLADIEVEAAQALGGLGDGGALNLPTGEREALLELGLVVPVSWRISDTTGVTR